MGCWRNRNGSCCAGWRCFTGGWTLEAAEAVCGGDGIPEAEVLDHLAGLVDKSLVILEWPGDAGRYRMLETVRQYATERLAESGETDRLRQRHAGFFLALAEQAEPKLFGPEQDAWFARLEAEHSNLRAALEWLAAQGDADAGLAAGRCAVALLGGARPPG